MPFEKKLNRKKRYRRPRRTGLNKRALTTVRTMIEKKLENFPEKKYFDTSLNTVSISQTQTDFNLTAITPSTGASQRIGLQVDMISIQYRLQFTLADTYNIIRFVIYQWLDDPVDLANVPFPSYDEMFQYGSAGGIISFQQLYSPLLINSRKGSFKILVDKHIVLDTDNPVEVIEGFINKGFKKKINFDTGTNYGPGMIGLMLVSDSGVTTHPLCDGYFRVRYTDS